MSPAYPVNAMSAATDAPPIDSEHPWPGLESYAEHARAWFHGREREAAALLSLVQREGLTVLYGRSGLGKTSLLQAGLAPLLRERGYLPVRVHLLIEDDAPDFTRQVAETLEREAAASGVEGPRWPPGTSLWEFFHRTDADFWTADDRLLTPVLTFDQFEEIFTLGRVTPECRTRCDHFLAELGDLVENRRPPALRAGLEAEPELASRYDPRRSAPRVLLAFREDYLADFDVLNEYLRARTSNRYRLLPMDGATAKSAVESAGGALVGVDVAERIIRFIDARRYPLGDLTIEPSLLSLFCRELNQSRLARGDATISGALLQDDRAQRIIEAFYIKGFEGLDARVEDFVESRLLTAAGVRDSCALENALATPGIDATALDTLVQRRILRREERGGRIRLELIHDVLVSVALAQQESRQRARVDEEAAQRRRRRSRRRYAALILLSAGLLTWNLVLNRASQRELEDLERDAKSDRDTTEDRLDKAAYKNALAWARMTPRGESAVLYGPASLDLTRVYPLRADYHDRPLAVSPDRRTVAVGERDGSVQLVDVASGGRIGKPIGAVDGALTAVAISPDGRTLASGGQDHAVRLWEIATQRPIGAAMAGHDDDILAIAFSPDGRTLATGSGDGTVRLWDVISQRPHGSPLPAKDGAVHALAFSPDGRTLASGSFDVRLWDVGTGRALGEPFRGDGQYVFSLAFTRDGRMLASQGDDNAVHLWDMANRHREAP